LSAEHVDEGSLEAEGRKGGGEWGLVVGEGCGVCGSRAASSDERMLRCGRCGQRAHQSCYGDRRWPLNDGGEEERECGGGGRGGGPGRGWQCAPCRAGVAPGSVVCELCLTSRAGPLKPTTRGGWAHVLCALLSAGVTLLDPRKMGPVGGVEAVLPERRLLVIYGLLLC